MIFHSYVKLPEGSKSISKACWMGRSTHQVKKGAWELSMLDITIHHPSDDQVKLTVKPCHRVYPWLGLGDWNFNSTCQNGDFLGGLWLFYPHQHQPPIGGGATPLKKMSHLGLLFRKNHGSKPPPSPTPWQFNITIENHQFYWENSTIAMAIFQTNVVTVSHQRGNSWKNPVTIM